MNRSAGTKAVIGCHRDGLVTGTGGGPQLPLSFVKIDRTFVSKLPHDVRSRRLVAAIVTIARQLDITNIAEGIETTEQAEYLTGAGCHLLQGYYFAPPAAAAEIFAAGASGDAAGVASGGASGGATDGASVTSEPR